MLFQSLYTNTVCYLFYYLHMPYFHFLFYYSYRVIDLAYMLTLPLRLMYGFASFIQGRGHHVMNGSVHHNNHDKDENSVTLAMQRITLMGPRYNNGM